MIGPTLALAPWPADRAGAFERFHEKRAAEGSWHQYNAHYWRRDFPAFLEFFFGEVFTEPHSTKQIEDCVGWGLEGGVDCLLAAEDAPALGDAAAETAAAVRCPMLVIHGDCDAITPHAVGAELARLTGGTLATIEGGGHCPQARDPVAVNLLIRDFVESLDDVDDDMKGRHRADPGPVPGRGRVRRARRCAGPLGAVRLRRTARLSPASDMGDRALADVEVPDPVPRPVRHRVTFDPRGNGRSDRPRNPGGVRAARVRRGRRRRARRGGVGRAVVVAWCDLGESLILAAEHPDRVAAWSRSPRPSKSATSRRSRSRTRSTIVLDTDEGWAKENRHYWLRDWRGYTEFFFGEMLQRAAFDKADRGRRRLVARDRRRDHASELPRLERQGDRARGGDGTRRRGSRARAS